ncbi:MAG: hypothetical protein U1E76_17715 [Planctomycetota bacterium]
MVGLPWILSLGLAILTAHTPQEGAAPAAAEVGAAERKVLLDDPNPALKQDAASELLKKKQDKQLVEILRTSKDQAVQAAIILAFTSASAKADDILHECLAFMALDRKDSLRSAASLYFDALYRSRLAGKQLDLIDSLVTIALDAQQQVAERVGAVAVLGELKQLRPVPKLIQLLEAQDAGLPQAAVLGALESITFRNYGPNPAAWREFYDQNGTKTREQLLESRVIELQASLSGREEEVAALAQEVMRAKPEALVHHLEHRDLRVRLAAIAALPSLASAPDVQPGVLDAARAKVFALLRDPPAQYGEEDLAKLVEAVGQCRIFQKGPVPEPDPSVEGSKPSGVAAKETPGDMVALLQGFLVNGPARVRAAAAAALRNYSGALVDRDLLLRTLAKEQLRSPPLVPLIEQLLRTIGVHWQGGELSVFTRYLASAPAELKNELIDTLGTIGDRSVIPALEAVMDPAAPGSKFQLRFRAAAALGEIGRRLKATDPDASGVLMPILGRGLQDEEAEVRVQCAQTLGQLNPAGALVLLADRLEKANERNQSVRDALISAIADVAAGQPEALDVLVRTLAKEPKRPAAGNGNGEKPGADVLHTAIVKVADSGSLGERLAHWAHAARSLIEQQAFAAEAWALDNLLRRFPPDLPQPVPDGLVPDLDTADRIRFALARAYVRAEQPQSAIKPFTEITAAGLAGLQQVPLFWQTKGQLAESTSRFDIAADAYEQQAKLLGNGEPQFADVVSRAARAYLAANVPEKACELMDGLLQRAPDSLDYLYLSGVACARKGDFTRAVDRLTKVVEADSPPNARDQYEALEKLCEILQTRGETQSMQALVKRFRLPASLTAELGPRLDRLRTKAGLN